MTRHICTAIALALATTPALGSEFSNTFQEELNAGQTAIINDVAREALSETPDHAEAEFALGVAQFLSAEGLGQGLHRYGLRNEIRHDTLGLAGLPFLRLPVPTNPDPEQVTYEGLREVLANFVDDLATAEATFASINNGSIALELNLGAVRIDLDGDGKGGAQEELAEIFDALNGRMSVDRNDLRFAFDESDVPWPRGYCHLLMAIADVPLAYDWERAFDATFHGVFPASDMPSSILAEEARQQRDAIVAYYDRPGGLPRRPLGMSWPTFRQTPEYREYQEFSRPKMPSRLAQLPI